MCTSVLVGFPTKWASLHHIDETRLDLKVHIPVLTACPTGTWEVEGAENSLRVFLVIALNVNGAMNGCQEDRLRRDDARPYPSH